MGGIETITSLEADVLAALVGFLASLCACLALIATERWHARFSHDGVTGVQKFHDDPVPRIGGVAIAVGYAVAWPILKGETGAMWGLIGLAGLPALLAGVGEDITKRVGVRARLLTTMGAGVLFALLTGYVMDKVDLPGVDWLLSFTLGALLFTGFSMGGVANAVNIIDGFNGLAAGALIIMFTAFAVVGGLAGDDLVVSLALVDAALVFGFFLVNFPYGRIFLGDGGAYFCGFQLAALGVLLPARNVEVSAWCAVLICAYPVIETLASMRRKSKRDGHSVGAPDRVHFHMLAHRRYARRIVRGGPKRLRNPATAVVTWTLPLTAGLLAIATWNNTLLNAVSFFAMVWIYGFFYRVMSLNPTRLPRRLARLL